MTGTRQIFTYRIFDNCMTQEEFFRRVRTAIPDLIKFEHDPNMECKMVFYHPELSEFKYPWPDNSHSIAVFNLDPIFSLTPPGKIKYPGGFATDDGSGRVTVGYITREADLQFGVRVLHEVTHALGVDSKTQDAILNSNDPAATATFCNYINTENKWYWKDKNPTLTSWCNATSRVGTPDNIAKAVLFWLWEQSGYFQPHPVAFKMSAEKSYNPIITFTDATVAYEDSEHSLNYKWDFGDGGNSSERNPTHTFSQSPGVYTIKLTVSSIFGSNSYYGYVEKIVPKVNVKITTLNVWDTTQKISNVKIDLFATVGNKSIVRTEHTGTDGWCAFAIPYDYQVYFVTTSPSGKSKQFKYTFDSLPQGQSITLEIEP